MIKVGLTGNYYSGQNEVAKILNSLNVKVFDADLLLKYLLNYSKEHILRIKSTFGENSYSIGLLNLNKFDDTKKWNKLIDEVEFDIYTSYEKFRQKHKEDFYTVFKYSYLFERQLNVSMDFNINCFRPKSIRKQDLTLLTPLSDYLIDKILDSEYGEFVKNKNADFLIQNYSREGQINLDEKVRTTHNKIMNKKPQVNNFDLGYKEVSGFWD
jgi:dephospho-CoA kinase